MLKQKQAFDPLKPSSQPVSWTHSLADKFLKSKLHLLIVLSASTAGIAIGKLGGLEQVPSALAQPSMAQELLKAHNQYRSQVGVPPLIWSNALARQAQERANYLSVNKKLEHRRASGVGENLWMGTSRQYSFAQMVKSWGNEQQHFVRGKVPRISNTGNWIDVLHYSQIVWRNTTQIGCAGVEGEDRMYRLVCLYSPPGNVMGQAVF